MTDKEIIIDGVDVSQCVYRMKDEYNTCCCTSTKENEGEERITAYYGCKYNHNCHYKQLKRKEQECEEYKQALDEIEQAISNFPSKGIQDIPQTQIECTQYFLSVSETKLQKILDIINKAKRADK